MILSLLKAGARLVLKVQRRWEVHGAENIPATGGVLLAANHVSYWDPVAIVCAVERQVYFMAKAELFNIPIIGYAVRVSGAFPVHRDVIDHQALRTALRLLQQGEVVGIFPEGTRNKSEGTLQPHLGAAMLALKTGVPVVPIAVIGSRGLIGKLIVRIGQPIQFDMVVKASKDELQKVSERIMQEINLLLKI